MKYEIWNLKPKFWNLNYEIWNLKSEIWNMKYEIWNLKPPSWTSKIWNLNLKSEIWNRNHRRLHRCPGRSSGRNVLNASDIMLNGLHVHRRGSAEQPAWRLRVVAMIMYSSNSVLHSLTAAMSSVKSPSMPDLHSTLSLVALADKILCAC